MKLSELSPGDLFTNHNQDYWYNAMNGSAVGESIYIRTNLDTADTGQSIVYKIVVEK